MIEPTDQKELAFLYGFYTGVNRNRRPNKTLRAGLEKTRHVAFQSIFGQGAFDNLRRALKNLPPLERQSILDAITGRTNQRPPRRSQNTAPAAERTESP